MIARIARALFASTLTMAATGCADRPYRGRLRGTWSISMTVETPLPGTATAPGTTVRGTVTVPDPLPVSPRAFPGETPTDVHLDLQRLGAAALAAAQPIVEDLSGDSVRLELGRTRNEMVLVGLLRGDSVTGVWRNEFRSGGCSGRFVMRRQH
jgi:hypothetical protein